MGRIVSLVLPSVALAIATAACRPASSHAKSDSGRLIITGSSTMAPLVAEIGKRFETLHPGVRVDVQTGGSSRGIADVRRGLADIGMVSRAMTEAESDLTSFALARDGVCLIVHADNPVRELTDDQIVGIYTGKIENWREVGGRDAPITVVHKAAGRATLAVFLEHFGLDSGEVRADVIIGDNEHGIKTVLGNPDAIGYVSVGTAEYHAGQGAPLRLLASHGVSASARHLQDGTFPIRRVLNLVTRATPEGPATPEGQAARFIAFTRSAAVSDLVREFHFVPTSS